MNINSVVFPQKLLISQGQVSLRWFIKTSIWAHLYWVALLLVTPATGDGMCYGRGYQNPRTEKIWKCRETPKAVVQSLPHFLGMEPGQLAKGDHTPGKGFLPWLGAGILIPLSPSPCSQASQSQLAAGGLKKCGTTVQWCCGVPWSDDGEWCWWWWWWWSHESPNMWICLCWTPVWSRLMVAWLLWLKGKNLKPIYTIKLKVLLL